MGNGLIAWIVFITLFKSCMGDWVSEKREYSLCLDCKYQDGTWVSDREVDTWCTVKKGVDCNEIFECDMFEGY